ncbi:MAG TPA: DUF1844 domain-containing protein [Terriglobales bacterium]
MSEKKQDFVVSDRRRFGTEGDLRTDIPPSEEEAPAPPAAIPAPVAPPTSSAPSATEERAAAPKEPETEAEAGPEEEQEMPPPPTSAEQQAQHDAYHATGRKLDEIFAKTGGRRESLPEMTYERLVESFYMTALLQLGAIRQEGETPAVDIIGARQTIDSLTILQEKTKGNLTDREQTLLQNVLFELRMAWIEITNALASAKPPAGPSLDKR